MGVSWFMIVLSSNATKCKKLWSWSCNGCLPEYLPSRTFFYALGYYDVKRLLLALYSGDISSVKRLHCRLSYMLLLYSHSYGNDHNHVTVCIEVYTAHVIQHWPPRTQSLDYLKCLPFGLTNTPTVFQWLMQRGLNTTEDEDFVAVYVDDVLVFSRVLKDHLKHLKLVFALAASLKLKPTKVPLCLRGGWVPWPLNHPAWPSAKSETGGVCQRVPYTTESKAVVAVPSAEFVLLLFHPDICKDCTATLSPNKDIPSLGTQLARAYEVLK